MRKAQRVRILCATIFPVLRDVWIFRIQLSVAEAYCLCIRFLLPLNCLCSFSCRRRRGLVGNYVHRFVPACLLNVFLHKRTHHTKSCENVAPLDERPGEKFRQLCARQFNSNKEQIIGVVPPRLRPLLPPSMRLARERRDFYRRSFTATTVSVSEFLFPRMVLTTSCICIPLAFSCLNVSPFHVRRRSPHGICSCVKSHSCSLDNFLQCTKFKIGALARGMLQKSIIVIPRLYGVCIAFGFSP